MGIKSFFKGFEDFRAKERDKRVSKFRNALTLEGVIIDKHFTPARDSERGLLTTHTHYKEICILGVKLTDGSEKVFHYYGSKAEKIYLFNIKGDKVSFKKGYQPFDIEEDIK